MGTVRRQYGSGAVFQRKDGLWIGRIEAGFDNTGKRRRVTVSAVTEARCKEKLKEKQVEIARSGVPEKLTGRKVTVKDWANEWLDLVVTELRPSAYAASRSAVTQWIIPTIGHKSLSSLAPADIRAVFNAQRKAGRKDATRARTHSVLMQMLKSASLEGHAIQQNVLLVKKPIIGENDREAIPFDACLTLLQHSGPDELARWMAALLQGMRQGECLGLRWSAIDFENSLIDVSWQLQSLPYLDNRNKHLGSRLPDAYVAHNLTGAMHLVRPKSVKSRRIIPMVDLVSDALKDWRARSKPNEHDLVWPNAIGDPRSAKVDLAAWRGVQARAGITHPTGRQYVLHEARHSTATLLKELGVDNETIEAILGHAKFVEAYNHADTLPNARIALTQLSQRFKRGLELADQKSAPTLATQEPVAP